VGLLWDGSPDADVIHYRLYWGYTNNVHDESIELGNTNAVTFTNGIAGRS